MKNSSKAENWLYAIGMVVIAEIFSLFQPIYTNVDNYIISMVINRVYAEDTYNMFLNPVLCWITAAAGRVFTGADGFTLVTKLVLLAGIGAISYFIAVHFREWTERLFWGAVLFLLTVEMSLFSDYFMVWSAFFSFVGMIWLLKELQSDKSRGRRRIAVGTFFICCGLMWRLGGFGLFIPFLLLDTGIHFLFSMHGKTEKIQYLKKCIRVFGPAILCCLVLLGIDYGYKHSEKYEDSVKFCDAVSAIVDFPMKSYEEVKDSLPGISQNDYESLENYLYADTDRITTAYCENIAVAGKTKAFHLDWKELISKTYSLIARFYGLMNFRIWCIALGMMSLLILFSRSVWYHKLELILNWGGAYLILMYLTLEGRLPERIMQSVLYAVMGIVMILYVRGEKRNIPQRWKRVVIFLFTAVVLLHLRTVEFTPHQSLWKAQEAATEDKWETLYDTDSVYIWRLSEYYSKPMRDFMKNGKLMSNHFFEHNICSGGWDFNQIYDKEHREELGVSNPVKALLNREHTYYIAENSTNMWIYLKEHYNESVLAVQVGEIEGIPIWKFEIEKTSA